ncbi:conserved protein of unknown function [Burkholderia multivorans]
MKHSIKTAIAALWLVAAPLAITCWWARHPDAVPSPPLSFWRWLSDLTGACCCEAMADLELLYMLAASFTFVSLVTLAGWRLFRRRHT